MLRIVAIFSVIFTLCFLSACTSAPKKSATTLNPKIVAQLKAKPMPSKLPIPVQGIKSSTLKDTWGASRSKGRTHEGIDIIATKGTKVFSTTEGLVADLRNNNLGGKVVWILGPNNSWHYYAHLSSHKRGLKVGDYVKRGDLIGYVGNTGNAKHTAPHLHYGIYLGGKGRNAVNPYPYLR